MKYQALSPDGFPINCNGAKYRSIKQAMQAIEEWSNNYKTQGYYSQACYNGYIRHIPVNQIKDYCDIITI